MPKKTTSTHAYVLRDTWLMFHREHECSVDRMLCSPNLRNAFLSAARAATHLHDEEVVLWKTVNLRKTKSFSGATK